MEQSLTESRKSSKDSIIKDLGTSQTSLKSTKSLDKSSLSGGSLKQEKNSKQFKSELHQHQEHEGDNQKIHDASLKVPNKIIANWRSACDKTKDKTKDLLKRWRTLSEIEADGIKKPEENEKSDSHSESCGWSVHVWTTWVDRFSVDSGENSEDNNGYQLSLTQSNKFSHFFTCLLDHDQDNLISEDDFEHLMEVSQSII